jgi:hypothetical protein
MLPGALPPDVLEARPVGGRAQLPAPAAAGVDERLRLLARALIDTAAAVHDQVRAAGTSGGISHTGAEALEVAAGSRYPATPRACRPALARRRQPPSKPTDSEAQP